MSKHECRTHSSLEIRHSFVIRLSTFDIRGQGGLSCPLIVLTSAFPAGACNCYTPPPAPTRRFVHRRAACDKEVAVAFALEHSTQAAPVRRPAVLDRGDAGGERLSRGVFVPAAGPDDQPARSELPLAGELSKSLGDLRVTLSKARRRTKSRWPGVDIHMRAADEFRSKLAVVQDALARYRKHARDGIALRPAFGDRSHESRTLASLEASLAELRKPKDDHDLGARTGKRAVARRRRSTTCTTRPARCPTSCTTGCTTSPTKSESSTAPGSSSSGPRPRSAAACSWPSAGSVLRLDLRAAAMLIAGSRRIAQQDDFDHRIHLKTQRRDGRAGRGPERHDRPLPGDPQRPRRQVKQRTQRSRPQRAAGQRRLSGRRRGPRDQQPAGLDRLVRRVARIAAARHAARRRRQPPQPSSRPTSKSCASTCAAFRTRPSAARESPRSCSTSRGWATSQKQDTDLGELVQGVIDMVRHLGKYRAEEDRVRLPGICRRRRSTPRRSSRSC